MNENRSTGSAFIWGNERPFNDLSGYLKSRFGSRIQKLSIDAGFTCPNRDGSKGKGGCTFCDNQSFNPAYCSPDQSVSQQLLKGMAFFTPKYPDNRYLAYFQAYTNTYGSLEMLKKLYGEALAVPGIIGIVIGTRPDCITSELLDYLEDLANRVYVSVEYGMESTREETLIRINRGHSNSESVKAIQATACRGIHVGAHLIFGLPGETEQDIMGHALAINALPLDMIKIHQLQIIRGTAMAREFSSHPRDFLTFTPDSYIDLVIRFLEILRPTIIVERFASVAPPNLIVNKRWGLKNFELVSKIEKEMISRNTYQGRLYNPNPCHQCS
ncbi:MAG: TIGR01212 family radical SAM protein [Bacteroidota bacterium]